MNEDTLDTARGILFAFTLGLSFWTVVGVAVWSLL